MKVIVVTGVTALCIATTVAVDRGIGALKYRGSPEDGLLFPPHSHARYETEDFTFTASINSLGFRDREFPIARNARPRALAIGDSYTFGWGVGLEESWPKVLESNLKRIGIDAEIANLGAPGASPFDYADIAAVAIPLLKPDLVLVAVLQGDDVEQLSVRPEAPFRAQEPDLTMSDRIRRVVRALYPNLLRLRRDLAPNTTVTTVSSGWVHEAADIRSRFSAADSARYNRISPEVRRAFERGRLNPPLINSGVRYASYWTDTDDPESPHVLHLEAELADQLERIKRVADANGAKVLVISVPMGHYVDRRVFEQRRGYGFEMRDDMLTNSTPDQETRSAAMTAGVGFVAVTDAFRQHGDQRLFFNLDTHLNVQGHRFLAAQVGGEVAARFRALWSSRTR